jgi:predicted Kef-type K+ transport protein
MSEFILIGARTGTLEFLREHLSHLSPMTRFIAGASAVFVMPQLSRRLKLPPVIGLLFAGIILGPLRFRSAFESQNNHSKENQL